MKNKFLAILILFAFGSISYFILNTTVNGMEDYTFKSPIDELFPVVPFFVIFYISAYFLVFYTLWELEEWEPFAAGMLLILTITNILFFFFPGEIIRPTIINKDIWAVLLSWIYTLDKPHNLFPSLHISLSFMSSLVLNKKVAYFWFILIAFSTLFTKQHYFFDILGGLLVGAIGFTFYQSLKKKQ